MVTEPPQETDSVLGTVGAAGGTHCASIVFEALKTKKSNDKNMCK
jgi:hypothetical protein